MRYSAPDAPPTEVYDNLAPLIIPGICAAKSGSNASMVAFDFSRLSCARNISGNCFWLSSFSLKNNPTYASLEHPKFPAFELATVKSNALSAFVHARKVASSAHALKSSFNGDFSSF